MQRKTDEGITIACDFCGTDWDEVLPMIEGHRGSVICLECVKQAIDGIAPVDVEVQCAMCLQPVPAGSPRWRPDAAESANPEAAICTDCMKQAAGAFSKDPDVPFNWRKR